MYKDNKIFLSWLIFGFIAVAAINSIIYFFSEILFVGYYFLDIPLNAQDILGIITPPLLYLIAGVVIFKKIIYGFKIPDKFPLKLFIVLFGLAFLVFPLTNLLISSINEYLISHNDNLEIRKWFSMRAWNKVTRVISMALTLLFLFFFALRHLTRPSDS